MSDGAGCAVILAQQRGAERQDEGHSSAGRKAALMLTTAKTP